MNAQCLAENTHRSIDAAMLDGLCLEALRHEVMAWPKPGLVSPVDQGSHGDMHIGTFLASISALQGSFAALAEAGLQGATFTRLQAIGIHAEQKMHRATAGINTHRGAIFNLGLLAAAAAYRSGKQALAPHSCGEIVSRVWGKAIMAGRTHTSHGNRMFKQFSAGGARAEAAAGFPSVYQLGVPALQRQLRFGQNQHSARIAALLALMEHLPDTNLLWRGGRAGLVFVQQAAADFNRAGGVNAPDWQAHLLEMHVSFIERQLSPGGSADLMAASCLVHQLEAEQLS